MHYTAGYAVHFSEMSSIDYQLLTQPDTYNKLSTCNLPIDLYHRAPGGLLKDCRKAGTCEGTGTGFYVCERQASRTS